MRARILLCGLTAITALGLGGCVERGQTVERGSLHIVGGQMNPGDPAVVYLSLGGAACTGSVIAKRWVMTAKHCVTESQADWIAVYEGANPMGGDGRALASEGQISRVLLYDDGWSIEGVDIALLESSVDLDVTAIPYSRDSGNPAVGETVHAVGYGQSDDYNSPDGAKRRGTAQVTSNDDNEIWTTAQICFGDSGGPLMDEDGTVIGISSRITNSCSYADDIFTNVGYFADWIAQYVPDEVLPDDDGGAGGGGDDGAGGDDGGAGGGDDGAGGGDDGAGGDDGGAGGGDDGAGGDDGGAGGGDGPAPDPGGDDPAPDPDDPGGGGGITGGGFGDACASGEACASSACVTLPEGGGYCTESCDSTTCPFGFECTSTDQGAFCFLQERGGGGAGGGGSLDANGSAGLVATCAATPGRSSGAVGLALALALALTLARRRPRRDQTP